MSHFFTYMESSLVVLRTLSAGVFSFAGVPAERRRHATAQTVRNSFSNHDAYLPLTQSLREDDKKKGTDTTPSTISHEVPRGDHR